MVTLSFVAVVGQRGHAGADAGADEGGDDGDADPGAAIARTRGCGTGGRRQEERRCGCLCRDGAGRDGAGCATGVGRVGVPSRLRGARRGRGGRRCATGTDTATGGTGTGCCWGTPRGGGFVDGRERPHGRGGRGRRPAQGRLGGRSHRRSQARRLLGEGVAPGCGVSGLRRGACLCGGRTLGRFSVVCHWGSS